MATAGVKVVISAKDQASTTLEKINARIEALQAPVRRAQAAFGRFASQSGLTRLGNGLAGLGRQALSAFRYMGQIVPVLGTLTGAASLAGIYKLSSAWSQFGTNLMNTSRTLGMAPEKLMAMQNAARLGGASAESMTSALQQLSDLKWKGPAGFAPEKVAMFQAAGIIKSAEELKTIGLDELYNRTAAAIGKIRNPAAQAAAALAYLDQAGVDLLPVFREGTKQWEEDIRAAQRHMKLTREQIEAADKLRRAQENLTQSVEGLGDKTAAVLSPALTPLLNQLSTWIDDNPRLAAGIGTVASAVLGLGAALAVIGPEGVAVVAAVGALAVAGYELWKHWEPVKQKFLDIWGGIKSAFQNNTGYLRTAIEVLFPLPMAIIGHWNELPDFFSTLWGGIKGAFSAGWSAVAPIVRRVREAVDFVANSWVGRKIVSAAGAMGRGVIAGGRAGAYLAREGVDWYADRLDRVMGFSDRLNPDQSLSDMLDAAAGLNNLSPSVLRALVHAESGGRMVASTTPGSSAYGYFPLTRATARDEGVDPRDPGQNVSGGSRHIARAIAAANGDITGGVMAYHDGLNSDGLSWLRTHPRDYSRFSPEAHDEADRFGRYYVAESAGSPLTVPSGTASGSASDGPSPRVQIDINNHNAPPGQSVRASTNSPRARVASVSQSRAMDPVNSAGGM